MARKPSKGGFRSRHGLKFLCVGTLIKVARGQVLSPIDGAVVGILQQPRLSTAFGRVELCHTPKDFQEDVLHDVFGLAGVPYDFQGNAQNEAMVAIEENGQGISLTGLQLPHQFLVCQIAHWRISIPPAYKCFGDKPFKRLQLSESVRFDYIRETWFLFTVNIDRGLSLSIVSFKIFCTGLANFPARQGTLTTMRE
jgi:hypothetical protein